MTQKSYNKQAWRTVHSSAKVSYISSCAVCLSFQPYVWYQLATLFHSIKSIPSSKYLSSYLGSCKKLKTGLLVAEGAPSESFLKNVKPSRFCFEPCQYIWNPEPDTYGTFRHHLTSYIIMITISSSSIPTQRMWENDHHPLFLSLVNINQPNNHPDQHSKLSPKLIQGGQQLSFRPGGSQGGFKKPRRIYSPKWWFSLVVIYTMVGK